MGSHPHPVTPCAAELVSKLKELFSKAPNHDVAAVQKLMESYVSKGCDWKDYVFFAESRYARNLIELNDMFELMVICWKPGQVSPIHNHAGSSCWMGVGKGELLEEYFHPIPRADGVTCDLKKGTQHTMSQGSVGYINDEIAIHRIRPNNNEALVSIHLYAPPIKQCQIYCPEVERISEAKMCYHTVQKCPVEGALPVYHVKLTE